MTGQKESLIPRMTGWMVRIFDNKDDRTDKITYTKDDRTDRIPEMKEDSAMRAAAIFMTGRNCRAALDFNGSTCLVCDASHSFLDKIVSGEPVVVFFQTKASLQLCCCAVVCVEDRKLFEIESASRTFYRLCCSRSGISRLVSSLSRLGSYGLGSCAGESG
jgi:hypothetical protein